MLGWKLTARGLRRAIREGSCRRLARLGDVIIRLREGRQDAYEDDRAEGMSRRKKCTLREGKRTGTNKRRKEGDARAQIALAHNDAEGRRALDLGSEEGNEERWYNAMEGQR